MASLIPGFECDVFISYRQKDNKYDGWVTEFVTNLKKELEATFKEDISVYFDINPHDGLLETHDVNASLKDKIKCLVFIPIISRTYCDPRSYAWENEFKQFIKLASKDHFGLKVKLPRGNVASRILPILIHDLGDEDRILIERELGGVLRAIDFIYKEPGVNRPLTPGDDENKNLNKTKYRNQINKLANAIDEIIGGLKNLQTLQGQQGTGQSDSTSGVIREAKSSDIKRYLRPNWRRIISGAAILSLIVIAALFAYPKIFKRNTLDKFRTSGERISVAVMPFRNMTNDTTWNIWQEGIQFNMIASLSNSADLKVRQTESINNILRSKGFADYDLITTAVARNVSENLDADVFVYGNINSSGVKMRLNAQLIDSKTEEVIKSFQLDGEVENMLVITDSLSSLVKNYLVYSAFRKEVSIEFQTQMPESVEAYKSFILGYKAFFKSDNLSAIKWFSQSIEIDSNYVYAFIWLSLSYGNEGLFDQAEKWCLKVYERREHLPMELKIWANLFYARYHEKSIIEELKYAKLLLGMDDRIPLNHWAVGLIYYQLNQYNNAIPELETMFTIYDTWNMKPMNSAFYQTLINCYQETGRYREEKKLLKKATSDFPRDLRLTGSQIILCFTEKDSVSANKYIEEYLSICKDNSVTEAEIKSELAEIFSLSGNPVKAERYYRDALSTEPANPHLLYDLGNFLINCNKNLNEGLELLDKALERQPGNFYYLDAKGWGLFRQGKFDEALKILVKSDSLKPLYNHSLFLHIQEVKKAIAGKK